MGVPKFFRWISERYPTISQLIAENRIPEFDNLYVSLSLGGVGCGSGGGARGWSGAGVAAQFAERDYAENVQSLT